MLRPETAFLSAIHNTTVAIPSHFCMRGELLAVYSSCELADNSKAQTKDYSELRQALFKHHFCDPVPQYLSREQLESLVRRLQDEVTDLRGRLAESEERNRILQFALPQAIRECLTNTMESLKPLLSPALVNPTPSITVDAVSDNPSAQPVRSTRSVAVQNDLSMDGGALVTNQQQCRGVSIPDTPLRPVLQELAHQVNSQESESPAGTRLSALENIKRCSQRMGERPRRRRPNLTRPTKRTYRGPRVGTRQASWTEHNPDVALRLTTHPFIKTTASTLVPLTASPPHLPSIQPGLTITSAVSTFQTQTLPKLSFYTDSHEPETSSPGECLLLGVEHHSRVQADTGTQWNTHVPENELQQQACDPAQQQQTNSNTDQNWLNLQDEFPGEIDWSEYSRTKREIGENPSILLGRPWSMYKASSEWTRATCALMSALFDPEQLSTSTVLGRGSSERRNRLPFDKVNYIVGTITQEFGVSPAKVRARMAQKCKDERRRVRMTSQTMGPDAV
ncbi:hypothetical protein CSKR_104158 [Clonorchis sinensis]|nr:hypothetical protein CSKR_104158 [Clonorchis sinensis]